MKNVAIVDDNPTVLAQLRNVLARAGFDSVDCYSDPEVALDSFARIPPGILVVDYSMPKLNGLELVEKMQRSGPCDHVPVVMFSGVADTERIRASAYQAGVHEVLGKPLKLDELTLKLKNLARLATDTAPAASSTGQPAARPEADDALLQRMLEKVAAVRDENTGKHTSRMAHYTATIAHHYGMSPKEQHNLLAAAPLHDIGKLGVPDHILLKAGPLSPEERAIMQRHTTIGYELLRDEPSPFLQLGAEIALSHHEHWDGTGYPNGLSGEEIPLSGRIVAIADVFDALTTIRSYKPAWLTERAVAVIRADGGGHFDPQVVQAFLSSLDDLTNIKRHFDEA